MWRWQQGLRQDKRGLGREGQRRRRTRILYGGEGLSCRVGVWKGHMVEGGQIRGYDGEWNG